MGRIAQLSDLHLTRREGARTWGSNPWANLRRVLDALEADPPDLVVLTGDVATVRRPQTYARLREWLDPWRDRLQLVPGNHDSRELMRPEFAEFFLPDRSTMNFVRELGGWQLVGLDSLRRPFVHGKLGGEQLDWLAAELAQNKLPVFVFVHHPPIRVRCWWLDKDRLRDRARLGPLLNGHARAIACGHVHQESEGTFAGARVWTCPSTAYQFRPRARMPGPASFEPAYRLFELDGCDVATRVVRL